jgi:hypothetical protein
MLIQLLVLETRRFKIEGPHLVRSFADGGFSVEFQVGTWHHMARQSMLTKLNTSSSSYKAFHEVINGPFS